MHASGRVQGVGYRFHIARAATVLEVGGYVRNLPDGSVEVVATGLRADLESLVEQTRQGPPGAYVDALDVGWELLGDSPPQRPFEVQF